MLKRGNPFTPEPLGDKKKTREYSSPAIRTPLRNVVDGGRRDVPRTPLNDDERERKDSRTALADTKRKMKKGLLSPAPMIPKANPPKLLTPKGVASPLTPSMIRTELAGKPLAAPKLTAEQRNKTFEEWMKIAADNNSWNVALIDYFSELTFLRDGDSINFQKASCTLDGCVKIYSTRVDSCADETGKLLNGLAEGGKKSKWTVDFMADSTETTMRQEDQVEKKTFLSKRAHRAVDTLERTFEALNLKHFDSEFSVDPLFKKMCAEFDESGSKGFLTCSLSLGANGRLLLDSNDAAPVDEIVTEIAADEAVVDIGGLVSGLVGLESRSVLPSLTNYSFGNHDMSKMDRQLSETLTKLATMTVSKDKMELDSDDDDAIHEEIPDFGDYDEPVPIDDGMYADYNEASIPMQETLGTQQVFEELEQTTVEAGLTHSFLTYFDSKLNHNWAGPEHWKIHRPHLHRASVESKPRVAKKEFLLDFEGDPVDVSTLFAKANPVAITLSKSTIDERNEKDNLLPEDLHFSSGQLLRLFIKPTWTIGKRMVTKTVTVNDTIRPDLVPEQELGAEYWADLANLEPLHHEPLSEIAPANNDDYEYDDEAPPLPLSAISNPLPTGVTQAIGDDLVPISRAITTNTIHYDRHAKKIDVQELKRILWVEIEALGKKPKSTTSFNSLMKDAQDGSMSAEMRKDVSVPYYFICLLHLANEHNLELKSASDDLLVSCSPQ